MQINSADGTTTYTYDQDGIRDSKTIGTTTYNYVTQNGKVVRQTWGTNVMDFIYDNNGAPYACIYNGSQYFYVLNLQGDVIGLLNPYTGDYAAEYVYDAWGNILSASGTLAYVNPLRYRGYYCDDETGFYYCQSRYYDPAIGRWISADSYASTGQNFIGYNMFAYCNNNPISYTDFQGELPLWGIVVAVLGAVAVIGADHYLAKNYPDGVEYDEIEYKDRTARFFYADGNGFEFDLANGATLLDFKAGIIETKWGNQFINGSLANLATVKASATADWSDGLSCQISGLASLFSVDGECIVPLFIGNLTLNGAVHIGAVGAGYEFDQANCEFGSITPGPIPGVVLEWEADFDFDFSIINHLMGE